MEAAVGHEAPSGFAELWLEVTEGLDLGTGRKHGVVPVGTGLRDDACQRRNALGDAGGHDDDGCSGHQPLYGGVVLRIHGLDLNRGRAARHFGGGGEPLLIAPREHHHIPGTEARREQSGDLASGVPGRTQQDDPHVASSKVSPFLSCAARQVVAIAYSLRIARLGSKTSILRSHPCRSWTRTTPTRAATTAACRTDGSARADSCCPRCRWACGTTSATTCRSTASGTSCAAPSISASPTSTWPTTTARRTGRPRRTSPATFAGLPPVPRTARHLHEGRLGLLARAVRGSGLPQVPSRQPRRVAGPHGHRPRRHLLPPPRRPGHASRGDDGSARLRRTVRPRALCRRLLLLAAAHQEGRRDPQRPRDAAADPPAVVLDAQPLGRGGPARHP